MTIRDVQKLIGQYHRLAVYLDRWEFSEAESILATGIRRDDEYEAMLKRPILEAFQVITGLSNTFASAGRNLQGTNIGVIIQYAVRRASEVIDVEIEALQALVAGGNEVASRG